MLKCRELTELVTDYLEGRMPARRRLSVQLHLVTCGHCRRFLRQMRLTIRTTGRIPDAAVPDELTDALYRVFQEVRPRGAAAAVPAAPRRTLGAIEQLAGMLRGGRGWALAAGALAIATGVSMAQAEPGLAHGGGLGCALREMAPGLALAMVVLAGARGTVALPSGALAAVAAAGAALGFAWVALTCPASAALNHGLASHVGGLALAVALGSVLALLGPKPRGA